MQLLDPKNNSAAAKNARAAIGPTTGMMGERFSQFNDPKGVAFRALIGRIGGILIKDTSGAAVSASEDARLKKWVPVSTDTPAAARSKLLNLINAIGEYQQGFEDIYNEDNGYRRINVRGGSGATPAKSSTPTRINSAADYANLPKGASYIAPGETKPRTKQ